MKYRNYSVLVIEKMSFSKLNLNDNFFASLRNDYNFKNYEFDNWFWKKQQNNEYAFVYIDSISKLVEGFLYLKIENKEEKYDNIFPTFESKKD